MERLIEDVEAVIDEALRRGDAALLGEALERAQHAQVFPNLDTRSGIGESRCPVNLSVCMDGVGRILWDQICLLRCTANRKRQHARK